MGYARCIWTCTQNVSQPLLTHVHGDEEIFCILMGKKQDCGVFTKAVFSTFKRKIEGMPSVFNVYFYLLRSGESFQSY